MNTKQNIFLGTALITFFSILFFLYLILVVSSIFSDTHFSDNQTQDILTSVFMLGLLYFPFNYGIKLRKRGLSMQITSSEAIDTEVILNFNTQISLSNYKQLVLALNFRNSYIIFISFLGLVFLLSTILDPKNNMFFGLIGVLFLCIPFYSIIRASQAFKTNKTLHEKNNFTINTEKVSVQGETFNSTLSWDSFYKVLELKEWLLLYTSKTALIPIPKNQIPTSDFEALKKIVSSNSQILKELK